MCSCIPSLLVKFHTFFRIRNVSEKGLLQFRVEFPVFSLTACVAELLSNKSQRCTEW
jgi:hypothetical protein